MTAHAPRPSLAAVACFAIAAAAGAAFAYERWAPMPSAEVARASEGAFADGVHPRELQPRSQPIRWTSPRAFVRFRDVPRGPATLRVALHGQAGPVAVAASGVLLGVLEPGTTSASFQIPIDDGRLDVELGAQTIQGGDRRLGALLDVVSLDTPRRTLPSPALLLTLAIPALTAVVVSGLVAGAPPLVAGALGLVVLAVQLGLAWPNGVARSPYVGTLAAELTAAAFAAGAFAWWMRRSDPSAGGWAFACAFAALVVQGVLATTPLMAVSDLLFHVNKLHAVAAGDLFPTSRTQHSRPFVIPYGVSFYALLAPLLRARLDAIALVQGGASLASAAASCALFAALRPRSARFACAAILVLQLLPGTFDIYSYGNLSNVFAQAVTVAFFAWWVRDAPGGPSVGAALVALACTAHLSGLIVLVAFAAALALARGRAVLEDRTRLAALGVGLALGAVYYLHFTPLILDAIGRLREGGGQGRGASLGATGALLFQLVGARQIWGLPALALAALGWPALRHETLGRDVTALWLGGLALAVPAVLSPLDVRYIYALTLPLAVCAGAGLEALARRGRAGVASAVALLALLLALAAEGVGYDVFVRYRAGL